MARGDMAFEWFERDDYPAILALMEDTHRLPATFSEWEKNAEAGVAALEAAGHVVVPTLIEPKRFAEWCEANAMRPDARGRLKFCNAILRSPVQELGTGDGPASPPTPSLAEATTSKPADEPPARAVPSRGYLQSLWKRLFGGDRN